MTESLPPKKLWTPSLGELSWRAVLHAECHTWVAGGVPVVRDFPHGEESGELALGILAGPPPGPLPLTAFHRKGYILNSSLQLGFVAPMKSRHQVRRI